MRSDPELSTLNAEAVKELGIVQSASDSQYRSIGYDLSVGNIVLPSGELTTRYKLPPQGIIEVISLERLHMPSDTYANVLIKTGLSNDGLLALGIGLVDPGYKGRLSSFIVNFSKDPQIIERGQSFLRCVFYRVEKSLLYKEVDIPDKDYISSSRRGVVSNFSDSFLNSERIATEIVDDAIDRYKKKAFFWIPALAFVLAFIAFLLNFGSFAAMQRWFDPRVAVAVSAESDLIEEVKALRERLDDVEQQVEADASPIDSESSADE
tara:strand:- start:1712 stop:2506 length:795 start_codon:yes stop_codon:yes gene_type:complete